MTFSIIRDEIVHSGGYIDTIHRVVLTKDGATQVWEMVKRKKVYGRSVMIAAVTKEGEILLERGFRAASGGYILELPAGLSDREGEPGEETAERELLEETGYGVESLRYLFSALANPALEPGEIAFYLGTGAQKVKEPKLEDSEDIEVVKVPVQNLRNFLLDQVSRGAKVDVKIFSAIPFLESYA